MITGDWIHRQQRRSRVSNGRHWGLNIPRRGRTCSTQLRNTCRCCASGNIWSSIRPERKVIAIRVVCTERLRIRKAEFRSRIIIKHRTLRRLPVSTRIIQIGRHRLKEAKVSHRVTRPNSRRLRDQLRHQAAHGKIIQCRNINSMIHKVV